MIFPTPQHRQMHPYQPRGHDMFFGQGPGYSRQQTPTGIQSMLQPENISSLATRGAGGLSKFLGNAQQVLKAIETTAPIVQQYGPMIKNIPALYRMMKAVNEIDSTDSDEIDSSDSDNQQETKTEMKTEMKTENIEKDETPSEEIDQPKKQERKKTGESKPLLYI